VWRLIHALFFCVSVILILAFASLESPLTCWRALAASRICGPALALELRKPVEQEVSAAQPQHYSVSLTAGQYSRLAIGCWGINVRVALYDPGGQLHTESIAIAGEERLFPLSLMLQGAIADH